MVRYFVINGCGGVGKDTFIEEVKKLVYSTCVRTVDMSYLAKRAATAAGWNGCKKPEDRRFLYDIKQLIDKYNDGSYQQVKKDLDTYGEWYENQDRTVLVFVNAREKDQIFRLKSEYKAETILVRNKNVSHISSNPADDGIENMEYDYVIENNGNIVQLSEHAKKFLSDAGIVLPKQESDKVIYISHPFNNDDKNIDKVKEIILSLAEKMPHHTFISPLTMFGFLKNTITYEESIKKCFDVLKTCDEMWVFGNYKQSVGCQKEIEFCEQHNIPTTIFE